MIVSIMSVYVCVCVRESVCVCTGATAGVKCHDHCYLLLQELLQRCAREGEEDSGGHVMSITVPWYMLTVPWCMETLMSPRHRTW
jgi:hypothetical protein